MPSKPSISRICERCGRAFLALPRYVNQGLARFCSRRCIHAVTSLAEYFQRYAQPAEGCWLWKGSISDKGYGCVHLSSPRQKLYAHRLSWMAHFGPIPDGLHVLHHCDNPPCVNPSHLFLGTHQDNMRDMVEKRRMVMKLMEADVLAIRASTQPNAVLARQYGVSTSTICDIQKRRTWRHL
jgi:hypothetical protein